MEDTQLTWRLGRWIAQRTSGTVQLTTGEETLTLTISNRRIVGATGLDIGRLADDLECQPEGAVDLLEEARRLITRYDLEETEVLGTAKSLIQEILGQWFADPDRTLDIIDETTVGDEGFSISLTHAIVELVLSDVDDRITAHLLPASDLLLRRSDGFLELYAPLRLSEEADLIVAKITGQRTTEDIASRSPHERGDVMRLLAALTAAGMLEVSRPQPVRLEHAVPEPAPLEPEPVTRKALPPASVLAAAIAAIAVVMILLGWILFRPAAGAPAAAEAAPGHWGVVVDFGCEPYDVGRLQRKADRYDDLLPIRSHTSDDATMECWRLVWGDFSTREAAESADPPDAVVHEGFGTEVIEIPEPERENRDE